MYFLVRSALSAFRLFRRFDLNPNTLMQVVGGVDHDFCVFGQAIEHFQTRAEIAPDMNILPVNMVVLDHGGDLRTLRAK